MLVALSPMISSTSKCTIWSYSQLQSGQQRGWQGCTIWIVVVSRCGCGPCMAAGTRAASAIMHLNLSSDMSGLGLVPRPGTT